MTTSLLSFLTVLVWVGVPVLLAVALVLTYRTVRRASGRRANRWTVYTRSILKHGEELIEVGIKRGLASGANRMPLAELDPVAIAHSDDLLYTKQNEAENAANRLNARHELSE